MGITGDLTEVMWGVPKAKDFPDGWNKITHPGFCYGDHQAFQLKVKSVEEVVDQKELNTLSTMCAHPIAAIPLWVRYDFPQFSNEEIDESHVQGHAVYMY